MRLRRRVTSISLVSALLLAGAAAAPGTVHAQDQAGITGRVVDETEAALPGVTVEARSPALIEQVRTVFTDSAGNYRFITLPPGAYSVTFTLPGFRRVVREGVVLTGAFVAPVDARLEVGGLEETVMVTGVAPLVDVVSNRQQTVLTTEEINTLPGSANVLTAMQYVPGVQGNWNSASLGAVIHGSDGPDSQPHVDGIKSGMQLGSRNSFVGGIGLLTDEGSAEELVFDVSSQSAEYATSGVRSNIIPKSGGNEFSGGVFAGGQTQRFISDNQSQDLKDIGFEFAPSDFNWNVNPFLGGPVVRDSVWFFTSATESRGKSFLLDSFWDLDEPSTPEGVTEDDLRAYNQTESGQQQFRLTWQISERNKLMGSYHGHRNNFDHVVGTNFGRVSAEALFNGISTPTSLSTFRWTSPVTSRLLTEVTFAYSRQDLYMNAFEENYGRVPLQDWATGEHYNTSFLNIADETHRRHLQASVSYVTGSHNLKAGLTYMNNVQYYAWPAAGDIFQAFSVNRWPVGLLVMANGAFENERKQNCDCGIYVQDAWTLDRFTLNLGLRYDWFVNSIPGGSRPAGYFTPELQIDGYPDVPNWKDWNARVGMAYDLFGDGSTALKLAAGRYVANEALGITDPFNPLSPTGNLDYRSWTDLNFDGTVINSDGTPQYEEIGPSFNPNFGTPTSAVTLDPDAPRTHNWEYSGGIERQLADGWSLSGMWHRRSYSGFRWQDNLNLQAGDWAPVTFTAPPHATLPNGGGEQIAVYEFADPSFAYSTGERLMTLAPDDWRTWNGFEVIVDGRLPRGGFMNASFTAGANEQSFCTEGRLDDPNELRFCEWDEPFRPMGKLFGAVPLPFDTMISGLFQMFSGGHREARWRVDAADIGRPLINADDAGTTNVELIEPGTQFYDATTTLLVRFIKDVNVGTSRLRLYMTASNIFNKAAVTARNQFFGGGGVFSPDYNRPTVIQDGRALSFGMQWQF
ncbi:MAG: carboxypeptidase regulatory-like domain-containing protein [Acidobacteria bacterium]|nr:carboxypeptidase regulatory-like domain-containing protein [Acidobacteriota bacterium]